MPFDSLSSTTIDWGATAVKADLCNTCADLCSTYTINIPYDDWNKVSTSCYSKEEKKKYDEKKENKDMKKDFKILDYKVCDNNGVKTVVVTFIDKVGEKPTKEHAVCCSEDTFDLERGIEVCVMKHVLGTENYKSMIKDAMKQVKDVDKEKEDKKKQEELIARKKDKAARKIAKRRAKQRQNRIDEMKEAYFEAMVKHDSYLEELLDIDDCK